MHLIRFSPHGTNSDIKVQGLWRIQVFRVNICGIPNFHADRRVITAQEQEITPYFKAYESSSRLHIYSRQTHFNIISQVIFSDYNIRHDCNLKMKSAIWRINSRIHALDETEEVQNSIYLGNAAEINFRCLTRQCVSITNGRHCNDAMLAMHSTGAHGSVRNKFT